MTSATKWPADRVERWAISKLTAYAQNPRTHSPEQIALIGKSIQQWGWTVPILVDEEGTILAGHGRVMAAQKLGLTEVPVMVARGWTEAQKRAYIIADNAIPMFGTEWDLPLLRAEIVELKALDFDLPLLGFPDLQLVDFVSGLGNGGQPPVGSGNGSLAEAFGVPPFSVLNAREGWWQDRKRAWISLGIQSELGRGGEGQPNAVPGGHSSQR